MPKKKKTALHNNPKVTDMDRRVLAGFAVSQAYDKLNYATHAARFMHRVVRSLSGLLDASERMVESGLVAGPAAEEEKVRIEEQRERIAMLEPILQDLAQDRSARLHEITDMEQALHQEYARQLRAQQAEVAKAAKKRAVQPKGAAKRKLLPPEEPVAPGIDLDPTLLAGAVKALNLGEIRKANQEK